MDRYALIDETGTVQGIAVWDGIAEWEPPNGWTPVLNPEDICAGIGWTYVDGKFIPPSDDL